MAETTGQFNLQQTVKIILRRKWFFIIPVVVCPVVFFFASFMAQKIYRAQSVILLMEKKTTTPLLKDLAVSPTLANRINALREEILAWPRLLQLVQRLKLDQDVQSPQQMEGLINSIRNNIQIQLRGNEVIVVAYEGSDPHQTQNLVNTLGDILIMRNISFQKEDTLAAMDFIKEQLEIYKKKLESAESTLLKFMEIYGTGQPLYRPTSSPEEQRQAQEDYTEGVTLRQINERLAALETALVMETVGLTEDHPRIIEMGKTIEALREKRNQYIERTARRIGEDPDTYLELADSIPRQIEMRSRLAREKETAERFYTLFLQRLESARITEHLDESENRTKFLVIEPARLPLKPVKPNRMKITLAGLLGGLAIGLGLIYLLELLDTSFHNENSLEAAFEYPVLGSITRILTEDDLHAMHRQRLFMLIMTFLLILLTIAGSLYIALKLGYDFAPAIQSMGEFAWNTKQTLHAWLERIKQVLS